MGVEMLDASAEQPKRTGFVEREAWGCRAGDAAVLDFTSNYALLLKEKAQGYSFPARRIADTQPCRR